MKYLLPALLLAAVAAPASATGAMKCNTPKEKWRTTEALTAELTKQGWQVRKAKVDGGCYEVYGTTPEGDRVEAYFDPASFEKLLVSRRGEVLYKKP
jgi:hypothetical protein